MKIVYDYSRYQNTKSPLLSDCLEIGPPLQPLISDMLLQNCKGRHCIFADIQKAFLQIRLDEKDRDAQRLVRYNNLEKRKIVQLRFVRVIIRAGPSPYIFGSTLDTRLDLYEVIYLERVKQ